MIRDCYTGHDAYVSPFPLERRFGEEIIYFL